MNLKSRGKLRKVIIVMFVGAVYFCMDAISSITNGFSGKLMERQDSSKLCDIEA